MVFFLFSEAKEAFEVIEASDVIMSAEVIEATEVFRTTQILKINNILARITLLASELRLRRTGMLLLTKSKGLTSNFHYSGFPNHLQTKSNLHISIRQSQILCVKT